MQASRTTRDGGEPRRSRDELQLVLRSITDGVTVHAPDGRMIFANQVLDADGRVAMAVVVFRDETDRRRAEQAWKFLAQASFRQKPSRPGRAAHSGSPHGGSCPPR